MARRIVIAFNLPPDAQAERDVIHRVRNFGEDLFREFDLSGLAKMDILQVDSATDQIYVTAVKKRFFGTVSSTIKMMLKRHNLDGRLIDTETQS